MNDALLPGEDGLEHGQGGGKGAGAEEHQAEADIAEGAQHTQAVDQELVPLLPALGGLQEHFMNAEGQAMKAAPGHKGPGRAMPQAADQHG